MARADSLTTGAQASSRSRNTRSAPELGAFCAHPLAAGRGGQLRSSGAGFVHGCLRDGRMRSDDAGRPEGGDAGRARCRAAHRRRRRCRRPGPGRGGRSARASRRVGPPAPGRSPGRGRGRRSGERCPGTGGARRPGAARRRRPGPPPRRRRGTPASPRRACARATQSATRASTSGPRSWRRDRIHVVGVLGQVGAADGPEDPHDDVGRGAGDGQPFAVGGPVGVAGGAGRQVVADPDRGRSPAGRRRGSTTRSGGPAAR